MQTLKLFLFAFSLFVLLSGCKKDDTKVDPNKAPIAQAGNDQTVNTGTKVTLNGSASSDPENTALTYTWAFKSKPTDSQATLINTSAISSEFTPDKAGTYIVTLTVTDEERLSASDEVVITSNLPGAAPAARAGEDITILFGNMVSLDASASNDPDGNALTYLWTFKTKPVGSNPALAITNHTQAKAEFTPDVVGEYILTLTVSDNIWPAVIDELKITVQEAVAITTCSPINAETTLKNIVSDPAKPDYVICEDLEVNAPLTIEPGVILHFKQNVGLKVNKNGVLLAKGTENQKIIFTGEQAIRGFWKGISIYSNDTRNELDYTEVSYGGSGKHIFQDDFANITILGKQFIGLDAGKIKITNSIISQSKGRGLVIQVDGELETFGNNTFSNNAESGIRLPARQVAKLDAISRFTGVNGKDVVEIYESSLDEPTEVTWPAFADGSKYFITGRAITGAIQIRSGLKIQEGAILEFDGDMRISVGEPPFKTGYLIAKGSAKKRIVFTGAVKSPGAWQGIVFYSNDPRNELDNTEISFGGSSIFYRILVPERANVAIAGNPFIGLDPARLKLTNSLISNSLGYGIYKGSGAILTLDNPDSNTYTNNHSGQIK